MLKPMFDMRSRRQKNAAWAAAFMREEEEKTAAIYWNVSDMWGVIRKSDFPEKKLSIKKFSGLPTFADINPKNCAFGTLFVCTPTGTSSLKIIGQIVRGKDILPGQWVEKVDRPPRGINRFKVKIV